MFRSILYILAFVVPIAFGTPVKAADYMLLPIDSVYDGDTIKTHVSEYRLPAPLNTLSVRIYGIDTPERGWRAACDKEAQLAEQAKAHVEALANGNSKMQVLDFKWDKYGGRILGTVKIGGIDVGKSLIDKGLAVPYFGTGAKKDWCQ